MDFVDEGAALFLPHGVAFLRPGAGFEELFLNGIQILVAVEDPPADRAFMPGSLGKGVVDDEFEGKILRVHFHSCPFLTGGSLFPACTLCVGNQSGHVTIAVEQRRYIRFNSPTAASWAILRLCFLAPPDFL